jgi:hypothetical protein
MIDLTDFLGPNIVTRDIEYKGKTKTFHFRELSADAVENLFIGLDADPKKNKGLRNRIIAQGIVTEAAEVAFTEAEAGKLPNELANLLQAASFEVNGLGKKAEDDAKNE